MNSFQESKNELEAAIRYCENAISSAQGTIESMEFRQEMAKKQHSEQTGREQALEREVAELKAEVDKLRLDKVCAPTMPVIPKAVAIAIFREGVQSGINDAVAELEGQTINICENEYCGDFEVTFARDIHLDEELDLDWMRDKVGQYNEEFVVDALKGLCASKEFECRIHGIDSND
jgi:predicted RecB family endonuclease